MLHNSSNCSNLSERGEKERNQINSACALCAPFMTALLNPPLPGSARLSNVPRQRRSLISFSQVKSRLFSRENRDESALLGRLRRQPLKAKVGLGVTLMAVSLIVLTLALGNKSRQTVPRLRALSHGRDRLPDLQARHQEDLLWSSSQIEHITTWGWMLRLESYID